MASIVLAGVSRTFAGDKPAVDRVSLEVQDGEFFVLVGPSGCGKSTTLRMIAGLERLSSGSIQIGGRPVQDWPARDRNLALVVQHDALYPHLSVRGNLTFGARLRRGSWWRRWWLRWRDRPVAGQLEYERQTIVQQTNDVARMLGIGELLERRPAELSGGERQRVALGRALMRRPAAFLCDEPLSNLDAPARWQLRQELKQLQRQLAATVLWVTHDQVEALSLGERIAVMDRGVIQQIGSAREIYERPRNQFVASFIGSPGMNFLRGKLAQQRIADADGNTLEQWWLTATDWQLCLGSRPPERVASRLNQELLVGIRPEHLQIETTNNASQPGRLLARVEELETLGEAVIGYFRPLGAGAASSMSANDEQDRMSGANVVLGARLAATTNLALQQVVDLAVDVRRLHWFDPLTGENIGLDDTVGLEPTASRRGGETVREAPCEGLRL